MNTIRNSSPILGKFFMDMDGLLWEAEYHIAFELGFNAKIEGSLTYPILVIACTSDEYQFKLPNKMRVIIKKDSLDPVFQALFNLWNAYHDDCRDAARELMSLHQEGHPLYKNLDHETVVEIFKAAVGQTEPLYIS